MSRDFRHGLKNTKPSQPKKKPSAPAVKMPSKRHWEDALRHAVRRQDHEAFEDYDEYGT